MEPTKIHGFQLRHLKFPGPDVHHVKEEVDVPRCSKVVGTSYLCSAANSLWEYICKTSPSS